MRINKYILIIEMLFVAFITMMAIILFVGLVGPLFTEGISLVNVANILIAVVMLCTLVAGWRIFFWVISEGPINGVVISKYWWVLSNSGLLLSGSAGILYLLKGMEIWPSFVVIFSMGLLLAIPYLHFVCEYRHQLKSRKRIITKISDRNKC